MRLQRARIEKIEKALAAVVGDELPGVVFHFPENDVYTIGGEVLDRAGFERYRAEWEARDLPVLILTLGGQAYKGEHVPPVFLEGSGVVKAPKLSAEEWEGKSIECHAASSAEVDAAVNASMKTDYSEPSLAE
jgi:hypothetical protein